MAELRTVKIADVKASGRLRKDMGDIASLAASIKKRGLLQAIAVCPDMTLIAGARRILAVKSLGMSTIDARVVEGLDDATALLEAERDENVERKDFTPSEMVAMGKALEELERPKAKERQKDGNRRGGKGGGEVGVTVTPTSKGTTRDRVGKALGVCGVTYERAKRVVKAAEEEPDKYGDLARKMDETGSIANAYNEMLDRKLGRSRESKVRNVEAITRLAAEGNIAPQIAQELGVTEQYVRKTAAEQSIVLPDTAMGSRRRRLDPNRIVAETVNALEGLAQGVGLVENTDGFDMDKVPVWAESMAESLKTLNRLCRRLKEATNGA